MTYQSKIFFTAIFSVVLLGKRLSTNQWIGIGILVIGVLCARQRVRRTARFVGVSLCAARPQAGPLEEHYCCGEGR